MNADTSWTAIAGLALAALGAFGGFVKWVTGALSKRDVAITDLRLALAKQEGRTDALVSGASLSESRMAAVLESVQADISEVTKRLDRLIEVIMLERKS